MCIRDSCTDIQYLNPTEEDEHYVETSGKHNQKVSVHSENYSTSILFKMRDQSKCHEELISVER